MKTPKLVIIGLLFLFTLITGILLSNYGRPLHNILFNIHKLIALISVIYIAIIIRNMMINIDVKNSFILLIIFSVLSIVVFVTGSLLSPDRPANDLLLLIHNISMILFFINIISIFYFTLNEI